MRRAGGWILAIVLISLVSAAGPGVALTQEQGLPSGPGVIQRIGRDVHEGAAESATRSPATVTRSSTCTTPRCAA